jgi:chaperonin GroES
VAVKIQPQAGYILAQQPTAEAKTASGFYLPEGAKETSKVVTVVSVGEGVMGIKSGDKVAYKNPYDSTEIKVGADTYFVIDSKNIVATIKETKG